MRLLIYAHAVLKTVQSALPFAGESVEVLVREVKWVFFKAETTVVHGRSQVGNGVGPNHLYKPPYFLENQPIDEPCETTNSMDVFADYMSTLMNTCNTATFPSLYFLLQVASLQISCNLCGNNPLPLSSGPNPR